MVITLHHRRCLSTKHIKSTRSSGSSGSSTGDLLLAHLLLLALLVVGCSSLQVQPPQSHRAAVPLPPIHRMQSSISSGSTPTMASVSAAAAATTVKRLAGIGKLHPSKTVLLLCDVQERFRPLIHKMETVINTCQYMTSVCQVLDVPILATQQYTKVFGPTISACFAEGGIPSHVPVLEKKKFSMLTDEVKALLKMDTNNESSTSSSSSSVSSFDNRSTYIIMGIEAHVCVQQTCLDLLELGKEVHVICDGVSSQQASDRLVALHRLEHVPNCYLTTAQSAAFMLLQSADHDCFKQVSKLTVEHMKKLNEFNIPQEKNLDII